MVVKAQFPQEQSAAGEFQRQEDAFRNWVTAESAARHPLERGRYQLYISWACPWASRTAIVRQLRALQDVVGLGVVDPIRDERGWAFGDANGSGQDPATDFHFLREAYVESDPDFQGRVTVPVLWDKKARTIVNNSEDDICRMFNDVFGPFGNDLDLFPADIAAEQNALSRFVYEKINNGVYRAGFATEQKAHEGAVRALFEALDSIERRLGGSRFLFGDRMVETDWRLFCTLIRFDVVYYVHFKCNLKRIVDYPNLQGYLLDLHQQPGIAETVNFDHIKRHYYMTHDDINPTRIVPVGPLLDLTRPHGREQLGSAPPR